MSREIAINRFVFRIFEASEPHPGPGQWMCRRHLRVWHKPGFS